MTAHLRKRVGKYYVGRTIGEGTYAKVKYGQHGETGEAVAIKVLDKEALVLSGMVEQIKREISILKQIRHPHIVNLLEVMSSRDKIFMVMELVTGGELFDKVVAEGPQKEAAARRMFSQLLDAVGHCHQRGIFHRDLKPENVLLTSNGTVKLSDFGLGVLPNPGGQDQLLKTTCGTPNYVAPEVLAKNGYRGGPADVWSLGVVLYVMLAGCLPFDEDDLVALFAKISKASYEVPPWLSRDAADMLKHMMNPDPTGRPTVEQLWSHPWMRGGLVRRSLAGWQSLAPELQGDIFALDVEPEVIRTAYQQDNTRRASLIAQSPAGSLRKINAFELIKTGLDISALFEARDDVVTRRTRFSSRAPLPTILSSIENAAVAVGGRVARHGEAKLRLYIPNPKGTMHVLVEVVEVLSGTHMVDMQKVKGNTVEFHKWYSELTDVVSGIISKKQPGPAGDVGAHAAAARRRQRLEDAGQQLRTNAFQLISSCFNISGLFEEEAVMSRHVQFSSRRTPQEILGALEVAASGMGGSVQRMSAKRAMLKMPAGGGRSMKLQAHLFEVLSGIYVCQIEKEAGTTMDFMRCYAQLASRLQPIMMKRNAFPTATHAASLLASTSSMDDSERRAIEELPHRTGSGASDLSLTSPGNGAEARSGSPVGGGLLAPQQGVAGLFARTSSVISGSRASLSSVPEESGDRSSGGNGGIASSSSSTPLGGSPLTGSSPKALQPMPTLAEIVPAGAASAQAQPGVTSGSAISADGGSPQAC